MLLPPQRIIHPAEMPQAFDPSQLHVISVLSNPIRYESRVRLFREYVERMTSAGVTLWIVEAAYGEREYSIQDTPGVHHIRVRCDHELWIKECMINVATRFIPPEAKYIGWQDADIAHQRNDWAIETLHALQHFPVVQPFSHAIDLGPRHEPMGQTAIGFAYSYRELGLMPSTDSYTKMHPGYAWFWRREAWDAVGGMIDIGILGSGDRHMAAALVGEVDTSVFANVHPNYLKALHQWQDRAQEAIRGNIGYVPGTIVHHFHGLKADRKYRSRWQILEKHQFDPESDITRDGQGLFRLRGNKPALRNDIQRYFRERSEDYHP